MKCYMLWHGGASYAAGDIEHDLEGFDSLRELHESFWRRLSDTHYPCVYVETPDEGGPSGYVYLYDPRTVAEPYPDRIISFGPRGGVRLEPA